MAVELDLTKEAIQSILSGVREEGSFGHAGNLTNCPNPGLEIPGIGTIGLPLSQRDAKEIILKAKQSPFGHKEATVVDTTVRKSWELSPAQFALRNPSWQIEIRNIITAVHLALKLKCGVEAVSAELYKLLLYEPGAFFKPHRDSEKSPGMFGTLIVCLPAVHQGGELVLNHNGTILEHKTEVMSDFNFSFAAWYSDITHEVKPVTSGYRLVLTYNLIRSDTAKPIPLRISSAASFEGQLREEIHEYDTLLRQNANDVPKFLVYRLDHKYTQASLKAQRLETQDYDRVQLLRTVCKSLGIEVYLGSLERSLRGEEDDEDFIDEYSDDLQNIVDLEGNLICKLIHMPDKALIGSLRDRDDYDDSEHEGYTGNEGAPIYYWYRDTVAVISPRRFKADLLFENMYEEAGITKLLLELKGQAVTDSDALADLKRLCQLTVRNGSQRWGRWSYGLQGYNRSSDAAAEALCTLLQWDAFDVFDSVIQYATLSQAVLCAKQLGLAIVRNGFEMLKPSLDAVFHKTLSSMQSQATILEDMRTAIMGEKCAQKEELLGAIEDWQRQYTLRNAQSFRPKDGKEGTLLATILEKNLTESLCKSIFPSLENMPLPAWVGFLNAVANVGIESEFSGFNEAIKAELRKVWTAFSFAKMVKRKTLDRPRYQASYHLVDEAVLELQELLFLVNNSLCDKFDLGIETVCNVLVSKGREVSENNQLDIMMEFLRRIRRKAIPALLEDDHPKPDCQELFTAFLAKYIKEHVGIEPQKPADWRRAPPEYVHYCEDCKTINAFLQDRSLATLDHRTTPQQRKHLNTIFDSSNVTTQKCWDVEIVKTKSPHIWRITKNNSIYSKSHAQWTRNVKNAQATLRSLKGLGPNWKSYLGSHFDTIMSLRVEDLEPILQKPLSENQPKTDLPQAKTGKKRSSDLNEDIENKRPRIDDADVVDLT